MLDQSHAGVAPFAFQPRSGKLDWRGLSKLDLERVAREKELRVDSERLAKETERNFRFDDMHDPRRKPTALNRPLHLARAHPLRNEAHPPSAYASPSRRPPRRGARSRRDAAARSR